MSSFDVDLGPSFGVHIKPLQGSDNYVDWSLRAEAVLMYEGLLDPIKKDYTQDINSDQTKNSMALATVRLLCADGPIIWIARETSAYRAWKMLEQMYCPKGFIRNK